MPNAYVLNTRRTLILDIEQNVDDILELYLGESNDTVTRPCNYLELVQQRMPVGTFLDHTVICDKTNNTPEDINNSTFNVDIYLRFPPSPENIQLNFTLGRSDSIQQPIEVKSIPKGIVDDTDYSTWPRRVRIRRFTT